MIGISQSCCQINKTANLGVGLYTVHIIERPIGMVKVIRRYQYTVGASAQNFSAVEWALLEAPSKVEASRLGCTWFTNGAEYDNSYCNLLLYTYRRSVLHIFREPAHLVSKGVIYINLTDTPEGCSTLSIYVC